MPKGNNAIANITSERVVILLLLILFQPATYSGQLKNTAVNKKVLVIVTVMSAIGQLAILLTR
jgi:hypothetical protein